MRSIQLLPVLFAFSAATPLAAKPASEPRTTAAVVKAVEEWSVAEIGGDPAYVDDLLLPGYVSVGADGAIHAKDAIVASARKHVGVGRTAALAQVADYRRQHPHRTEVKLFGDTAIVSYLPASSDPARKLQSSDILVYREGRWHAIYSQHAASEA